MNILLIGATGFVGKNVLNELSQRQHTVTAFVRDPAKVPQLPNVKTMTGDVYDTQAVAQAAKGHDVVLSAFNAGWDNPNLYDDFTRGSKSIEDGVEASGVKRLIIVGGAGSLYVAPGVQLVDTPEFPSFVPENIIPGVLAAREALSRIQANTVLEWTFVSPPALLLDGERTGEYRLGENDLLMDGDKPASISVADFAIALVDEIENANHIKARFTVATQRT